MSKFLVSADTTQQITQRLPAEEKDFEEENETSINNLIDNKHKGKVIECYKEINTFRIFACNPNGFRLDTKGGEYAEFLEQMKQMQVDTICIAEHNLDINNHNVNQKTKNP